MMAIYLRHVTASAVKEQWPMPNLDAEMVDFSGSPCFASLDFVSGYWQLPLETESYSACGIMTPNRVYSSRKVPPGLANSAAFFQPSINPWFKELEQSA